MQMFGPAMCSQVTSLNCKDVGYAEGPACLYVYICRPAQLYVTISLPRCLYSRSSECNHLLM